MNEKIIRIENVSKVYRLGQIGGRTLAADMQSFFARISGREDPNTKLGAKVYSKNESFTALDSVSFDIRRGETVGIIGRNGAGKSTLLKILSRITAPTEGVVYLDGRVSSMLEIGTGFHGELTGRENIYLNGAILGMSKKEVDDKIDSIIEFSECERFIDTPIKRYSSGMYVKLAFAVAAHLDSEILIMDEVLAVGDMEFQRKCIDKMRTLAENDGKTALYVSHNMDTVKNLCGRTVVLDKGRVIFDGDTARAVEMYLGGADTAVQMSFGDEDRHRLVRKRNIVRILDAAYPSGTFNVQKGEMLKIRLRWESICEVKNLCLRITVYDSTLKSVATAMVCDFFSSAPHETVSRIFSLDTSALAGGRYETRYTFFLKTGAREDIESVMGLGFYVDDNAEANEVSWRNGAWGSVVLAPLEVSADDEK